MFEPGDKVKIKEDQSGKVWMVIGYPWKCWHDTMGSVGDENGQGKAVNADHLQKVEESREPGDGCAEDFCEVREEMHLE